MSSFTIPEKAVCGFDARRDTFTDRLGFVTYHDHLGELKQKNSWEGWRDKTQEPLEFDNVPTSGFILNKNGGGTNSGWGHYDRAEFFRVWDPRGFEIEISTDNLLKIIAFNGISKGNGIEGELAYAWKFGAKKLTLLPVTSDEYINEIKRRDESKDAKLFDKKTDIEPGKLYKFKHGTVATYLGQFKGVFTCFNYSAAPVPENGHIFTVDGSKFLYQKNFNHVTHVLDKSDRFDTLLNDFTLSAAIVGLQNNGIVVRNKTVEIDHGNNEMRIFKFNNNYFQVYLRDDYDRVSCYKHVDKLEMYSTWDRDDQAKIPVVNKEEIIANGVEQEVVFVLKDGQEKIVPLMYGSPVYYYFKDLITNTYGDI